MKPFKILKYLLLLYVALCGFFYFYQHLFFFQPKPLPVNHEFSFPVPVKFTSVKIPYDSATVIDVVKFLPEIAQPKGVVLFFHGNRYNVEHYSTYAPFFTRLGYECWMPDYPGYGRSTGELTVPMLKDITLQLYKMARAKYAADSIVVYGKSLGSGLAAYLASKRDCALLLMETPYESLSSLTSEYLFMLPVKWLLRDDINTAAYLPAVLAPTIIWHGSKDELIPLSEAARLMQWMKPSDRFYVVEGGRHNGISKHNLYQQSLDSAMATITMANSR